MAIKRQRWRLSNFGTIAIPDRIRESAWCYVRVEIEVVRGWLWWSKEVVPDRSSHGYVVLRDADGFVIGKEFEIRFRKNSWMLWDREEQVNINLCKIANFLYSEIMLELAKKPNTPPLLPTLPPANPSPVFNFPRVQVPPVNSITVTTRLNADFTVEFVYFDNEGIVDACAPRALPLPPGQAPLEDSLPDPSDDTGLAPPPESSPPTLPPGAPPLGGTAIIPPGYQPADQARPPVQLFWAGRCQFKAPENGCQVRTALAFATPRTPASQPNPYSLVPPRTQQPSDDCAGVRRQGFAKNGEYVGDIFGLIGEVQWVKVVESARE